MSKENSDFEKGLIKKEIRDKWSNSGRKKKFEIWNELEKPTLDVLNLLFKRTTSS